MLGLGSEKPDLTAPDSESFIIDFMAYCRKVATKKIKIQTYEAFVVHLFHLFLSLASKSKEIHMIFDNYFNNSIKASERFRRKKSKAKSGLFQSVSCQETKCYLPLLSSNKHELECYMINWVTINNTDGKPIYLAGADTKKCILVQNHVSIPMDTKKQMIT